MSKLHDNSSVRSVGFAAVPEYASEQTSHLEYKPFMAYIEENFGKVKFKAVLYRGKTNFNYDIPRIKVEDFLLGMYQGIKINGSSYEPSATIEELRNLFEQTQNVNNLGGIQNGVMENGKNIQNKDSDDYGYS